MNPVDLNFVIRIELTGNLGLSLTSCYFKAKSNLTLQSVN